MGTPVRYWLLLFLFVNVAFPIRPTTNPLSRYALLCAMVEDGTFRIDRYRDFTIDWARTPDGHYYSNKAPGPALAAFPIFWAIDRLTAGREPTREARDHVRWHVSRMRVMSLLSFVFQALPMAIFVALLAGVLAARGLPTASLHFFALAALFGNTAALFVNSYFGHAFAAACILGLVLALFRGRTAWAGFFLGWALLSDYGAAVFFPFVLAAVRPSRWLRFAAGGIAPAALWIWYHVACFGSPLTLPHKFQNPDFVDAVAPVWGVLGTFPDPRAAIELLVGTSRGILWTQPWVIVLCVALPFVLRRRPELGMPALVLLPPLALLLCMNAMFGAWHAGDTPGPRYLSLVFPALALPAALCFPALGCLPRAALWGGLAVSLALYFLFMAAPVMAPPFRPLWPFYLQLAGNASALLRLALLALLAAWAVWKIPRTRAAGRVP